MAPILRSERQARLSAIFSAPASPRRPLLTHLSADNSWLLSIPSAYNNAPSPAGQDGSKITQRKKYIHLLLDAWLTPSNTPFKSMRWFQVQSHVDVPACTSISDVVELIMDIETIASAGKDSAFASEAVIDAVIAGHWAPDHLDYDTLKQVNPSVPVFVPDRSISIVQSWQHFENVVRIPDFGATNDSLNWRTASSSQVAHLPPWVTVWRLYGPRQQPALHWGICIIFGQHGTDQVKAECVVHTPHGLYVDDATILKKANPPIEMLALMHTTKQSFFYHWGKANLGAQNGVRIAEEIEPKYWISTHDEIVTTAGMNKWFLTDVENDGAAVVRKEKENGRAKGLQFAEVGNGNSFLLA